MSGCREAAPVKLLGAVLAGGRSSRFGSDKAEALFEGSRLLDHSAAELAAQVDALIVVGREYAGHDCVPDRPAAELGPLGGLAGALTEAERREFDAVLSCSVDNVMLPDGLRALLAPGPTIFEQQPTVGLWPISLLPALLAFIDSDAKRSLRGFAAAVDARILSSPIAIPNINRPADLARLNQQPG